jgi:malonate-semialdehyde dehydrogenase (acetylating) / methylmalonate-semialdehyde dehydrogenase
VKTIGHFIGGRQTLADSTRTGPVYNPASGEQSRQVAYASTADVDTAVASALAAFASWREVPLSRRSEILFAMRDLVKEHTAQLAELITSENGKTLGDAEGEVLRGLENLEFACGIPSHLKGEHSAGVSRLVDVNSVRYPLGVVAGITPFNFPAMVPLWMFANAIACGNCFVLKPSEKTPSASMLLAELWQQAGLPDGVFNVVQGDREAVDRLLCHPDVAAISFVGSTPVARYVYATAASHGKRVQALGGAKNHMIVLPDADIDMAADAAVSAGYGASGERCMAISVVVAVGDVADPLVDAISARTGKIKVGSGADPGTEMGPLVTKAHRDRVAGYLDSAAADGAAIVADGRDLVNAEGGFFLGPCLIDHVRPDMKVYTDEVFGPVLSVVRAPTYDTAIEVVNANRYGNGVAIFTRDGGAASRFSDQVDVGMIGVNVPIPVPVAFYSFGGWKDSLFGDLSMYGPDGVRFYTRSKVVTTRWPDPATSVVDLGFPRTR